MRNKLSYLFASIMLVATVAGVVSNAAYANGGTCPQSGGWIKIDSGDLSSYPVTGAVEYCFKAGNWPTVSSIPLGGFGQPGGGRDANCNTNIKYCDLSHWSYFVLPSTNTPVPTNTPPPTPTPTDTPVEPTPTPTDDPGCEQDCETPPPTPTDPPTIEPTPTATEPPPLETPELPSTGDGLSPEPWQIGEHTWAAHNGCEGQCAGEAWVYLWPGTVFDFHGTTYIVTAWFRTDPSNVGVIDSAPLVLITCTSWDGMTWTMRLIVLAEPASG